MKKSFTEQKSNYQKLQIVYANINKNLTFLLITLSFFLFPTYIQAQEIIQEENPYTVFDGVTWERYVSYLKLNGYQGVQLPIDSLRIGSDQEYTLMLWFKPNGVNWNKRFQYAFQFDSSLECYFTATSQLMCDSIYKSERLEVDVSAIGQNQWSHISLVGHPSSMSTLMISQNQKSIGQEQNDYIVLEQKKYNWSVCLGGCQYGQYSFVGGMREFIFINKYLTIDTTLRLKNTYLLWDSSIIAYYRFSEGKFFQDEFQNRYAEIPNYKNSFQDLIGKDYIPNDICLPLIKETQNFYQFSSDTQDISQLQIDKRASPQQSGWAYSLSLWVRIDDNSCTLGYEQNARQKCFLVKLRGAFMLYLPRKNTVSLYLFKEKSYYEYGSKDITIPENQWVNIQFAIDQADGYEIRTYNLYGKLMYTINETINFDSQIILDSYKIDLLRNFKGIAKSLIIYNTKKALPIIMPSIKNSNSIITDKQCLLYFKFTEDSIIKSINQPYSRVVNYCKPTAQYFNGTINNPTKFVNYYTADYAYGVNANVGSIKTQEALFDGIACNDGSRSKEFLSSESQITAQIKNFSSNLTTLTVEFWFKLNSKLSLTNTIFSLKGNKNFKNQYTTILFNKTNQSLLCHPYGTKLDPEYQSAINYSFLTEQTRVVHGWMHIVCQFDSLTTNRVNGYIYTKNAQVNYTKAMTRNFTIPQDDYIITLGSSLSDSKSGTPNMLIKELRVWAVNRTFSDISQWRYRQIDPSSFKIFNFIPLMIYLRLAEDNYQEFNFASITSTTIPSSISQKGIGYQIDNELTVCPINTYHGTSQDQTIRCYVDPVKVLIATVYLQKNNKDGNYYWVFDSSQSLLINQVYSNEIQIQWSFDDQFIQKIIKNQSRNVIMQLPTTIFKDENSYSVRLTYTNTDQTFTSIKNITFIPISCKLYVVNNQTANSSYLNYTQPQATEDITFTLDPITVQQYCSNISFYNSLKYKVRYQFVPPLNYSLELNVSYDSSGKISVTIPKYQQYKIPIQVDQKIIFSIYYTSSLYDMLIEVDKLTFQNLIYTINFKQPGNIVMPQLLITPYDRVLMGENAILNASLQVYSAFSTDNQKQQELTFSWQCPKYLEFLCFRKNGSILNISTSDFDKAGGIYNKLYTFSVIIQQTQTTLQSNSNATTGSNQNSSSNTSTTQIYYFYASANLTWLNVYTPSFKINSPSVRSTLDSQFSLEFQYYNTNITNFNISWSIVPNLSVPLNLTKNNTLLTIKKGGIKTLETYTMTVKVSHKELNFVNLSQSITFTTFPPPYGGTVSITPTFGYEGDEFTVTLKDWKSSNPPIYYRVWATSNSSDEFKSILLTSTWIIDSQQFKFIALGTYPYIVEITDQSNEIVEYKTIPAISSKPDSQKIYTWSVTKMISIFEDDNTTTTSKYSYMSQYVEFLNNQSNSTNQQANQMKAREIVLDQIQRDIQVISNETYIGNGESQVIIKNSLSMINSMTVNPEYLNDNIINLAISVMDELKSTNIIFEEIIFNDDESLNNYMNSISNLLKYSLFKQKANKARRLGSYDSSNTHGLINLNLKLKDMLDEITNQFCNKYRFDLIQKDIKTESFNILIKTLSQQSQEETKQFVSPHDQKTRVIVKYKDLIKYLSQTNPNKNSLCAFSVFQKQPIVINTQTQLTQHSQSLIEFKISEKQEYNSQNIVSFYFKVDPKTFKSNQTVCMTFMNETQLWKDDSCLTIIVAEKVEVQCQCNLLESLYTGVFTDSSRHLGSKINFEEDNIESQSINYQPFESIQNSVAFTAIIAILFTLSTAIPTISIILDKRDYKLAITQQISQQQMKLLKKLSKLSHQTIEYWKLKNEEVLSYSIRSKSLFSHIFFAIHPFVNVLTYFDAAISRITRFSLYFLQISIFALICINVFGPSYRENYQYRFQEGLQMQDIDNIIAVGIIGMFILLPIPYNFLKIKHEDNKESIKKENEAVNKSEHLPQSKSHSFNGEITQKDFQVNINETIQTKQTRFGLQLNSAKNVYNSQKIETFTQQYSIQPLCRTFQYIIIIVSYIVSLIALVLVVVYSTIVPVANQYCMVTSFYIGLFGSIFVTNIVRVIMNTVLAELIVNKGKLKWISIFISNESLRIVREINLVRKAEASLNSKTQTNLLVDNNVLEKEEKEEDNANDSHKQNDTKSIPTMPIDKVDSEIDTFKGQSPLKEQDELLFSEMSSGRKLKSRNKKPSIYDQNIEGSNEYQNNRVKFNKKQQRHTYSNIQ